MEYTYSSTNFRNYEKKKLGLLKNKICKHLFYVDVQKWTSVKLDLFLAWHMVKKPGSHMPVMHLRHGRRYCLGYCSDKRTEVAGNLAIPVFTAGMPAKLTEVELHRHAGLRASSPIWVSEVSLAARSRVLARLASLAQIGELAHRLQACWR